MLRRSAWTTIEREIARIAADNPVSQRLMRMPGIGLITATALVGTVGNIHAFARARRFARWLGLTPSDRLERRPSTPRRDQQAG